jgi:hypothetical protein
MNVSRRRRSAGSSNLVRFQVFLSYAGDDGFEASLLQYAIEQMLADMHVIVWTYERDQRRHEGTIGKSIKDHVSESHAMVFLLSSSTLSGGAAQWMELAYADREGIPTFIILHHLTFDQLKKRKRGVPPMLLERQCNASAEWKRIVESLRNVLSARRE